MLDYFAISILFFFACFGIPKFVEIIRELLKSRRSDKGDRVTKNERDQ